MPYLRRYTWGIVIGLFGVLLMGIIGNVIPLATGVITDTLAGSQVPFEHSATHGAATHSPALVTVLAGSRLSRSIPYYAPFSRRTLGIYCLIVLVCVSIKGLLSFMARWTLIGVSRDIEFDIRNDLLKRLLLLEPEFYVRNRTGELMSRATNDLNSVRMVLGPGIMYSATTLVTMIMASLVMITISPSLTVSICAISRALIFGSSGVCGLAIELLTASAIAGSQRYFEEMVGSVRAALVPLSVFSITIALNVATPRLPGHGTSGTVLKPWGPGTSPGPADLPARQAAAGAGSPTGRSAIGRLMSADATPKNTDSHHTGR